MFMLGKPSPHPYYIYLWQQIRAHGPMVFYTVTLFSKIHNQFCFTRDVLFFNASSRRLIFFQFVTPSVSALTHTRLDLLRGDNLSSSLCVCECGRMFASRGLEHNRSESFCCILASEHPRTQPKTNLMIIESFTISYVRTVQQVNYFMFSFFIFT